MCWHFISTYNSKSMVDAACIPHAFSLYSWYVCEVWEKNKPYILHSATWGNYVFRSIIRTPSYVHQCDIHNNSTERTWEADILFWWISTTQQAEFRTSLKEYRFERHRRIPLHSTFCGIAAAETRIWSASKTVFSSKSKLLFFFVRHDWGKHS